MAVEGNKNFTMRVGCVAQTTYMGKPSAIGQPTRPTQPFIFSGSLDE